MPHIRSVKLADNSITFVDSKGITHQLLAATIPATQNTIAKVEAYINTVWIPAHVTEFQMQVHVFSLNPLRVTVGTWNIGLPIPANWWTGN